MRLGSVKPCQHPSDGDYTKIFLMTSRFWISKRRGYLGSIPAQRSSVSWTMPGIAHLSEDEISTNFCCLSANTSWSSRLMAHLLTYHFSAASSGNSRQDSPYRPALGHLRQQRRAIRENRDLPEELQRIFDCLGQRGGLKQLERSIGFGRRGALAILDGRHAPWLWDMAKQGNEKALDTLIRYNAEDVASLPFLADFAVLLLSAFTPIEVGPGIRFRPFDCSVIPYDCSVIQEVIELEPL